VVTCGFCVAPRLMDGSTAVHTTSTAARDKTAL
jgi:hypothetical protein